MSALSHEDPQEYLEDMNEEFTDVTNRAPADGPRVWLPAVDVKSTSKRYVLEAELPGMAKSDVEVKVEDDRLLITGSREETTTKKSESFLRKERFARNFKRVFRLPADVNRAKIEAEFDNGVLTIDLPRGEDTSRSAEKTIRVKSG